MFGSDLRELRAAAVDVESRLHGIPGIVDLQVEPQVEIPQVRLRVDHREAARHGLAPGDVASLLETAYKGRPVSQVFDDDRFFSLVVWYDEASRNSPAIINETILDTPSGRRVALGQVAQVFETTGPNTINRENVQRRIVVSCNVADRDLSSVVRDIAAAIEPVRNRLADLPGDYSLELGGQFEAQQEASRTIGMMGLAVVGVVFLLLAAALSSAKAAGLVMLNLPLSLIGGIAAVYIAESPSVIGNSLALIGLGGTFTAPVLSIASLVGFITLFGIAVRNGILLINQYQSHAEDGRPLMQAIMHGSEERLVAILMTALCAAIGLIPLALRAGQPGAEILAPLAIVVLGGLVSSTILNLVVVPAAYAWVFGQGERPHGTALDDTTPPQP